MRRRRVLILGAAGRDFHNFNVLFRDREEFEVIGFTAAQIPDIAGRTYPAVLAGGLYPKGIPIVAEQELEPLVAAEKVDEAWFSYSDLAHVDVMHLASRSIAAGAHFVLAAAQKTMLTSIKPVVAITAVRTGVGKIADDALRVEDPQGDGQEGGRRPPSDALRRSLGADLSAFRDLRRPRQAQVHDRGARGVRAAHRQRLRGLRRRRLREDPARGRGGGGRHPLGRRQQRHLLLHPGAPDHPGRSAPAGARGDLPPRRGECAARRSHPGQQGEHRRSGEGRRGRGDLPRSSIRAPRSCAATPRSASPIRRRSAASGSWSSRTARRSPTAA